MQLGAEVSTVDECFEAILSERGMAFSQASTQRFYDRPGLAFIPVTDIPPTMLSIAWRTDVDSPVVRDFVETAKAVASLSPIPDAWIPSRFSQEQTPPPKPLHRNQFHLYDESSSRARCVDTCEDAPGRWGALPEPSPNHRHAQGSPNDDQADPVNGHVCSQSTHAIPNNNCEATLRSFLFELGKLGTARTDPPVTNGVVARSPSAGDVPCGIGA